MSRRAVHFFFFFAFAVSAARGQDGYGSYNERVKKYVGQYFPLAIAEQKTIGIPASITLAQGILETDGGASDLVNLANNHFGIKCTPDWQGETITHDDETANECFRKYKSAAESYRDHSEHLRKNPRYQSLFSLSVTDYASWAVGLRKCGYATNQRYAERLIKIIEDFKLQEYTYSALDTQSLGNYPVIAEAVRYANPMSAPGADSQAAGSFSRAQGGDAAMHSADQAGAAGDSSLALNNAVMNIDTSRVVTVNGMRAVYVTKGEQLLPYAVKYHLRYQRLLEMNDLGDEPAPFNMYLYLEKKLTYGTHENHKVEAGESLQMISQTEGLQLKKLMGLNQLNPNEEPVPGSVLELQKPAAEKPEVTIRETIAHKENAIVSASVGDPTPKSDYIYIDKNAKHQPDSSALSAAGIDTAATAQEDEPAQEQPVADAKPRTKQEEMREAVRARRERERADSLAELKKELDKEVYAGNRSQEAAPQAAQPAAPRSQPVAASVPGEASAEFHVVQKGETLSAIAAKSHITVKQLLAWNHVDADKIRAGQKLRVAPPDDGGQQGSAGAGDVAADDAKPASPFYVVQPGDNVTGIARKNHITVKQLLAWNGNLDADKIRSGQKLRVTGSGGAAPEQPAAARAGSSGSKYYVVQKGETLSGIARKNGISVKQLLALNESLQPDKIRDGQKLRVAE